VSAPALSPTALCVTAVEAVTPLGFDAEQSCAAVRAGVNRFAEHPFHVCLTADPENPVGEPLIASLLSELDPELLGRERLLALAVPTCKALLAKSGIKRADLAKGGLLLSLPDAAPGSTDKDASALIADLCKRLGIPAFKVMKACRLGHTGMASSLQEASKLLAAGEVEFCLVAGLESHHEPERLERLDEKWRIKSERNADGYTPGEAAVALLLETAARAAARKAKPLGILSAFGFGKEARPFASELLSTGEGLSKALQPALSHPPQAKPTAADAGAPGGNPRWVLCDMNGESYRAAEWGIVLTRLGDKLDPVVLTHPADCLGDVGAASGGILIAYALHAFHRGYAPAGDALIWNASDDGARSALLVSAMVKP
jgi:3-oxoacyl-[acyl-carrier-protein] synthase I